MDVGLMNAEMLLCYVAVVIWKMHEYKIGYLLLEIVPTLISNLICSNGCPQNCWIQELNEMKYLF